MSNPTEENAAVFIAKLAEFNPFLKTIGIQKLNITRLSKKNFFFKFGAQVQRSMSADLLTVTESVRRNHIALKGVINAPHIGYSGALQNLNQNFRNSVILNQFEFL